MNMPDFYEISLLSPEGGEVLVSSRLQSEGDFRVSDTYFTRGLQEVFIQEIYLSPVFFKPTITIAGPMYDEAGQKIGVVAGHLDLSNMDRIILKRSGLGRTGESYLVDSTNAFIAGEGFGRSEFPRGAHSYGIEKALERKRGTALYKNYAGIPVVGAFKWIEKRNLALMAEISQQEAFAPARALAFQIIAIGCVVTLMLTWVIYLVARRIASPILAVRKAAERISHGDSEIRAPVVRDDEIGDLARSFNIMVDAIQEGEEKFRTVFRTSPGAIVITRASDGVITDVNDQFVEMSGFTPEEVLGKKAVEVGLWKNPGDREMVIERLRAEGSVDNFELEFTTRDSLVRTTLLSAALISLQEEPHVIFTVKDITSIKEGEMRLRESEERYRLLAENVSDVIWVWDEKMNPVYVSPSIIQLRGFTPEEWLGMSLEENLTPESCRLVRELVDREMDLETRGRGRSPADGLNMELEMYCKGGRTVWTEVSIRVMRGQDGSLTGLTGTTRDITRRKMAEKALKESEERYRVLFNSGSDAVFVHGIGKDGTPGEFFTVNDVACQMLDMSRRELMELTPLDIGDSDTEEKREKIRVSMKEVLEAKRKIFESVLIDKKGRKIPVEMNVNLIELYESKVAISIARDLSERRKVQEEKEKIQARLLQANKMTSLGLMVSSLGHEINNPNNTIMFNLRRFARTWDDIMPILDRYREEQGDFNVGGMPYSELRAIFPRLVSGTLESSEMIKAIIENLKGFVRQSSDAMDFDVDINDVVRRSVNLLESQVRKGVGQLEMDLPERLPRVKGNPQKLVQVLVNLISNSLESVTDGRQRVTVRTGNVVSEDKVFLEVSDEGAGMDREQLARIFEPFYSTKMDTGGTGLGMTITKMLLDEHHAHLDIQSEPGAGTRVTATFAAAVTGEARKKTVPERGV